mgnify:CR=1 FL=1
MTQLVQTIRKVKMTMNPELKIQGVVMTLVDNRTNLAKDITNLIRDQYGSHMRIFNTTIPTAIKAAESAAVGQSIYTYDTKGTVAKAYENLTKEVLRDGQRNKAKSDYRSAECR